MSQLDLDAIEAMVEQLDYSREDAARCVTHHHACACGHVRTRDMLAELAKEVRRLRESRAKVTRERNAAHDLVRDLVRALRLPLWDRAIRMFEERARALGAIE